MGLFQREKKYGVNAIENNWSTLCRLQKISHIANISVSDLFVIKYVCECVRVRVCVRVYNVHASLHGWHSTELLLLLKTISNTYTQMEKKQVDSIRLYYMYTPRIASHILIAFSEYYLFKQIRDIYYVIIFVIPVNGWYFTNFQSFHASIDSYNI